MLSIPYYHRRGWSLRLGITTFVLSAGLLFGYGIPVATRIADVVSAENAAEDTIASNHFWRMVAGQDAIDGSDFGRVAATTRRLGDEDNPIRAFIKYYVAPGELPDLENRLGFHAFDRPDPQGTGTLSDEGHFTDRFILHAIQAAGLVPGSSYKDLIRPIPQVPEYGYLRWEWGVGALAGLWSACGLFGLWLRRDRRRWPARAKARAIAELTDEQRHVYRIITSLESEPYSEDRDELIEQAKALFKDMRRGLDTGDKLAAFRTALSEATETWQVKRDVYRELTGSPTTPKPPS